VNTFSKIAFLVVLGSIYGCSGGDSKPQVSSTPANQEENTNSEAPPESPTDTNETPSAPREPGEATPPTEPNQPPSTTPPTASEIPSISLTGTSFTGSYLVGDTIVLDASQSTIDKR